MIRRAHSSTLRSVTEYLQNFYLNLSRKKFLYTIKTRKFIVLFPISNEFCMHVGIIWIEHVVRTMPNWTTCSVYLNTCSAFDSFQFWLIYMIHTISSEISIQKKMCENYSYDKWKRSINLILSWLIFDLMRSSPNITHNRSTQLIAAIFTCKLWLSIRCLLLFENNLFRGTEQYISFDQKN